MRYDDLEPGHEPETYRIERRPTEPGDTALVYDVYHPFWRDGTAPVAVVTHNLLNDRLRIDCQTDEEEARAVRRAYRHRAYEKAPKGAHRGGAL